MEIMYTFLPHTSPVKRKVLGDINNLGDSPISPTANLKLLTKVATAQYDSIENFTVTGTPPKPIKFNRRKIAKGYQRKLKSLGYLCDKFLKLYPLNISDNVYSQILLTDLANELGVEKRRIYDIINVVESLQMATKVGKNSYTWTGHKKLADTLSQLKAYAEQIGLGHYVRSQQLSRGLYMRSNVCKTETEANENCVFEENPNISSFFRNERRIGVLCQKFVMLFLVSVKGGLINLELAAHVLIGENCQQNQTRLRRLYDIANILVSLGIINKLDLGCAWKKPVFQYIGPTLIKLENISKESAVLSGLVKCELSDGPSSDLSEDSSEVSFKAEEGGVLPSTVTEIDHPYSIDVSKTVLGYKPPLVEPAAKKRLVFSAELLQAAALSMSSLSSPAPVAAVASTPSTSVLNPTSNTIVPSTPTPQVKLVKSTATFLRVLGQGSVPQPLTNGGVYKAVRVGNDIQLIRIDSS